MLIYIHESGENLSPGQGQGGTIAQAPEVLTTSHVLPSVQYICFRKTSFANIGAANLFLALGAI